MRIVFFVGMRVVLAMVGDPADRPAFRAQAPMIVSKYSSHSGPNREAAMREQAMIGHANPDPARQPVQENANGKPGPGEKGGYERQKSKKVYGADPDQGDPSQPERRRLRVVVVVMINLCASAYAGCLGGGRAKGKSGGLSLGGTFALSCPEVL